mmetsp:Transcript_7569/g.19094  ORF Transcript_7569/g.19094 Transcript_7569/m.19094 type:complete len:525 (+) Transcript_7569:160-1734(+)
MKPAPSVLLLLPAFLVLAVSTNTWKYERVGELSANYPIDTFYINNFPNVGSDVVFTMDADVPTVLCVNYELPPSQSDSELKKWTKEQCVSVLNFEARNVSEPRPWIYRNVRFTRTSLVKQLFSVGDLTPQQQSFNIAPKTVVFGLTLLHFNDTNMPRPYNLTLTAKNCGNSGVGSGCSTAVTLVPFPFYQKDGVLVSSTSSSFFTFSLPQLHPPCPRFYVSVDYSNDTEISIGDGPVVSLFARHAALPWEEAPWTYRAGSDVMDVDDDPTSVLVVDHPRAGPWYIMVKNNIYNDVNVTLQIRPIDNFDEKAIPHPHYEEVLVPLSSGAKIEGSVPAGSWRYYRFISRCDKQKKYSDMCFRISISSQDGTKAGPALYIRRGAFPVHTPDQMSWDGYAQGSFVSRIETLYMNDDVWYVGVRGVPTGSEDYVIWFGSMCAPDCDDHGRCKYHGDRRGWCECDDGHEGYDCTTESKESVLGPIWWAVIVVVIVFAGLALLFGVASIVISAVLRRTLAGEYEMGVSVEF